MLTEGELVLATEVEGGEYPAAVLDAIAAGRIRCHEIKDWIRAEPARTLDRLVELRLVDRIRPVTESERSRRRLYRIPDPFLAFYLRALARGRRTGTHEIDAVALAGRSRSPVLVGAAKWARPVNGRSIIEALTAADMFPGPPH